MTTKETMEENMINQMMMQMAPQSMDPDSVQTPQQLDQIADMKCDGQGLPIPGDFLLKEGKYYKMKDPKELCWLYENDKGYIGWVRSHITPTSSPGMQKFRIYVHARDQKKKERVKMMKLCAQPKQMPIPKSMMGYGRPEPRQLSKGMKLHSREEAEMMMKMDWQYDDATSEWEVMSMASQTSCMQFKDYKEMMVLRWAHLVNQMKMRQEKKTYQMEAHLMTQRVTSHALANFLVNMTHP